MQGVARIGRAVVGEGFPGERAAEASEVGHLLVNHVIDVHVIDVHGIGLIQIGIEDVARPRRGPNKADKMRECFPGHAGEVDLLSLVAVEESQNGLQIHVLAPVIAIPIRRPGW